MWLQFLSTKVNFVFLGGLKRYWGGLKSNLRFYLVLICAFVFVVWISGMELLGLLMKLLCVYWDDFVECNVV
jgi:hypothetical protein